uniref:Cytochrome P450 n=1 Tax=Stomoxys calcitrans TaxID=35570 RepID=A0A1I8PJ13_STOCA
MYNEKKPFMVIECLLDSMLFVQDLEAIKEIMITQFENFPDRGFYVNHREALSVNLSRLEYDMWKPVRHKLTPSFSPAKVRNMFPILLEVTQKLIKVLAEDSQRALDNQIEILDLCSRFTIDIIGNVAFGIECNSLENPQTEFLLQGNRAFLGILNPFWDMFGNKYPKILQFLNVYVFSRESNAFFKRVFQETKAFREKNNVRRNDFMDLLLELKLEQGEDKDFPLTSDLLVGQLFAFFIAGFETNACTLTYALYELAKHPDIQEKARQEVMQLKAANNQKLTYDSMKQLKFLKAIVQETLRKYPIGSVMPRVCVRQCTIKTSYNTTLTIQPGTFVLIPFYGVHHNPDYYPEPEKFLPQRLLTNPSFHASSDINGNTTPVTSRDFVCFKLFYHTSQKPS